MLRTCDWRFTRVEPGVYRVLLTFPAAFEGEREIGTLTKEGRRWRPAPHKRNPEHGNAFDLDKTRDAGAYSLVKRHLGTLTGQLREQLPTPYTDNVGRQKLNLTEEQANKVWDVLVEYWGAYEGDRDSFVHHAQVSEGWGLTEWRCGWGKFRQGHYHFGVSQYAENVTPWSEYIMAKTGIALQALYEEFYGVKADDCG